MGKKGLTLRELLQICIDMPDSLLDSPIKIYTNDTETSEEVLKISEFSIDLDGNIYALVEENDK